jgi:hypothetical protein
VVLAYTEQEEIMRKYSFWPFPQKPDTLAHYLCGVELTLSES